MKNFGEFYSRYYIYYIEAKEGKRKEKCIQEFFFLLIFACGNCFIVDVNEKRVVDIIVAKRRNSKFERPTIPLENHHFLPEHLGEQNLRKDLKPLQIVQPEGVSFAIRGQQLDWQKWNMHLSFNYREGLVINNVNYRDMDGTLRPMFYRVSLAEMVVPYANPYKPYNHKMAFDVGEYGLGMYIKPQRNHNVFSPYNLLLIKAS